MRPLRRFSEIGKPPIVNVPAPARYIIVQQQVLLLSSLRIDEHNLEQILEPATEVFDQLLL
jgi:hypothetical protein